ncbi:hypothetical protein [Stenotrophomonas sp.]|uniref:hypothetical protein n=1 Tax=Stenotrophomonas sp. TaxID=69392 RepID=UPI002FC8468F
MPVDEIAGSLLGGFFRFVAWLVVEFFIETILRGSGYWILRVLRPHHEASDTACTIVGLLAWAAIAVAVVLVIRAGMA